ncbi:MAG: trypsin-like peptidase domain-containing protein, partial [Anaerolineae bacterium]|nr:trypsin-like peptidase domain-containing protein [Anaerolineae bacterium]
MKQFARIFLVIVALAAILVISGSSLFSSDHTPGSAVAAPVAQPHDSGSTRQTQTMQSANAFTQIYYDVSPSVVAISVSIVSRNRIIGTATGSGFVIDDAGYIMTNNHVVEGASQIEVDFYDGTLAWAEIVGVDPDSDLAVLKVDVPANTLHSVTFGDSDALQIGETVLAIGSPFG